MWSNQDKGDAFEGWVQGALQKYVEVEATNHIENYDLRFRYKDLEYLLECKCYNYWHKRRGTRIGEITVMRSQVAGLWEHYKMGARVYFICGFTFNDHDLYATVVPYSVIRSCGRKSNGVDSFSILNRLLMRKQSFRGWLSNMFDVEQSEIQFPTFVIEEAI